MSIGDIAEIDLPVIILIILKWIIDYFRNRKIDEKLDELRTRPNVR